MTRPGPHLRRAGVLVSNTDAVAMAALGETDPDTGDAIPARARVELGARPSCMAVSKDGERVAVGVDGKVGKHLST